MEYPTDDVHNQEASGKSHDGSNSTDPWTEVRSRRSNGEDQGEAQPKRNCTISNGHLYEELVFDCLCAKAVFEGNKKFSVSREVRIKTGGDEIFDDVVYEDEKISIFIQVKHKEKNGSNTVKMIDSNDLSSDLTIKKKSAWGMARDFNFQQYLISFLSRMRTEKRKRGIHESGMCEEEKKEYFVIFTNCDLDNEDLKRKGFSLVEAPDDVEQFFALGKLTSETQQHHHCYQLSRISDTLRTKSKVNCSDLGRLSQILAIHAIKQKNDTNEYMESDKAPIKYYRVALAEEVFGEPMQRTKENPYYTYRFKETFIDCQEQGSIKDLRDAIEKVVSEQPGSYDMQEFLRGATFRSKTKLSDAKKDENILQEFPKEWEKVTDKDIDVFLNLFVYVVKQPEIEDLQWLLDDLIWSRIFEGTLLQPICDKIRNAPLELRNQISEHLGLRKKIHFNTKSISSDEIVTFLQAQIAEYLNFSREIADTQIYKNEVLNYVRFFTFEVFRERIGLSSFLCDINKNVLCIRTPDTLPSSIKLLQLLDTEVSFKPGYCFVDFDTLLDSEHRKAEMAVLKSAENNLLIIVCRPISREPASQKVSEIYDELARKIVFESVKIIFITQEDDTLVNEFAKLHNIEYEIIVDEIFFRDLTSESRKEVLKTKVNLQGTEISLSKLMGGDDFGNISGIKLNKLNDELDWKTLAQHVTSSEKNKGRKVSFGDDLPYYIKRIPQGSFSEITTYEDLGITGKHQMLERNVSLTDESLQEESLFSDVAELGLFEESTFDTIELRQWKDEDDFLNINRQNEVVIISAPAGMGKSTFLKKISRIIEKWNKCLIRIDLNDHTDVINKKRDKCFTDISEALEFISIDLLKLTGFKQAMFKHCDSSNMIVLFDGFDAVSIDENYQKIVLALIQILRANAIDQIWVTTRPNMLNYLEGCVFELPPLSFEDQKKCLKELLQHNLKLSNDDELSRLQKFSESQLSDDCENIRFYGIPLHIIWLGEELEDYCMKFCKFGSVEPVATEKFDLKHLMQSYIKKKFDICLTAKHEFDLSKPDVRLISSILTEQHQNMAILHVFSERTATILLKAKCLIEFGNPELVATFTDHQNALAWEKYETKIKNYIQDIRDGKINQGIISHISDTDKPQFVDKRYAEYFVAEFLSDTLKQQKTLLDKNSVIRECCLKVKEIIEDQSFAGVKQFMDSQ